jgi:membrane associated rhomboid family serine protease
MGIYDRDYYREQQPGLSLRTPRTMVGVLVLINVVVFLANLLLTGGVKGAPLSPRNDAIAYWLSVKGDTLSQPYLWWQFLTYGFVHAPHDFSHILFNMLVLWIFGRPIEDVYGPKEFLRLYLVMLVLGSLVWTLSSKLAGMPGNIPLMGASGAVVGVLILFVFHFPRQTILFMFILPMPAWLFGVLLVAGDLYGAINRGEGDSVAYTVHLTGAAFAFLYHRFGWRLSGLVGFRSSWPKLKRRPKLRIHHPENPENTDLDLSAEVDRILEKIHRSGERSLTRKERRVLEEASREYQRRRQDKLRT